MSQENERVIYEPHPVSPERKAELRAQGFKIIDARFAPVDDGILPDSKQREILIADLKEKGLEFDDALPTDELRALSVPLGQAAPAKRGRKPAQPQE